MHGLSPVSASAGLSLQWPLLLRSTDSRCTGPAAAARRLQSAGSAVAAHALSCSAACGILPDQGSNPLPPHWQADSQPLRPQGSPVLVFLCPHVRSPSGAPAGSRVAGLKGIYIFNFSRYWQLLLPGVYASVHRLHSH